jgi:hypothetical protein
MPRILGDTALILSGLADLAPVFGRHYKKELDELRQNILSTRIDENNCSQVLERCVCTALNARDESGNFFLTLAEIWQKPVVTKNNASQILQIVATLSKQTKKQTPGALRILAGYMGNIHVTRTNCVELLEDIAPVLGNIADIYGPAAEHIFRNIAGITSKSFIDPARIKQALEELAIVPGVEVTPSTALLINALLSGYNLFPDEYNLKIGQFIDEAILRPGSEKYVDLLSEAPGLRKMEIGGGAHAVNDAASCAKLLMRFTADSGFAVPEIFKPRVGKKNIEKYSFEELTKNAGFAMDARFVSKQGRTLIFEDKSGELLCVKIIKNEETQEDLAHESEVVEFFKKEKMEGEISPEPVRINGNYLFELDMRSLNARERLRIRQENKKDEKRGYLFLNIENSMKAIAYKLPRGSVYNKYLQVSKTEDEFLASALRAARTLSGLAEKGVVHTSLIDSFHNLNGEKGRRYLWTKQLDSDLGTQGAGRIMSWRKACEWPNISMNGEIRDLAEFRGIDEVAANIGKYLGPDSSFFKREKGLEIRNTLMMHFLGEYAFAFILLYGDWMVSTGNLSSYKDEKRIKKIANAARKFYYTTIRSFLGKESESFMEEMDLIVNWERMAKQMVFFMGDEYIKYVDPGTREKHGTEIWTEIYGPDIPVGFQPYEKNSFDSVKGFIDISPNGKFLASLGPVNGGNPLQEVITANYYIFSSAVTRRNLDQREKLKKQIPGSGSVFKQVRRLTARGSYPEVYNDIKLFLLGIEEKYGQEKKEAFLKTLNNFLSEIKGKDVPGRDILWLCVILKQLYAGAKKEEIHFSGKIPALDAVDGIDNIKMLIYNLMRISDNLATAGSNPGTADPEDKHLFYDIDEQAAKAGNVIDARRGGTRDIIIMPCFFLFEGAQFAVGKEIEKDHWGKDIKLLYYSYDTDREVSLKNEIKNGIDELISCLDAGDRSARQLAYIAEKDLDYVRKVIDSYAGKLSARKEVNKNEIIGRITLIPLSNIPDNGTLNDIHFIIAALGLLNAERFLSGDYPGESFPEASGLYLVEYLDTIFENILSLGGEPSEIIRKILSLAVMEIKRVDFSEVTKYKARQKAFRKSL